MNVQSPNVRIGELNFQPARYKIFKTETDFRIRNCPSCTTKFDILKTFFCFWSGMAFTIQKVPTKSNVATICSFFGSLKNRSGFVHSHILPP